MKLVVCALLIGLGATSALAVPVTPYDFTGHWTGNVQVGPQTGAVFADFSGTQTFTGTLAVNVGQLLTCTVQGTQKRKVKLNLTCSNTSKAKLKGTLDTTTRTITGRFHSTKKGRVRARGTFTVSSPGTCEPTGGDCTDPTTGGGESAVCCNGDCSQSVDSNGNQSHSCN